MKEMQRSERGAAVLLFLGTIVPILLLAALLALDLDADRLRFNAAIESADRGVLTQVTQSINYYFNNFSNPNVHWPKLQTAQHQYNPQSTFMNLLVKDQWPHRRVVVSSEARVIPLSWTVVLNTHQMNLDELSMLREEIADIWVNAEKDRVVPFELASILPYTILRMTSTAYHKILSEVDKAAYRERILNEQVSLPTNSSLSGESFWRYMRNIVFARPHDRHKRHVIMIVSRGDPLSLLTKNPLQELNKATLCNDSALGYDIINIQYADSAYSKMWIDPTVCSHGRVAVAGISSRKLKLGETKKILLTMLKSVTRGEVLQ